MAARKKPRQAVRPRARREALAPGKAGDASLQQLLAEARAQQVATAEILKVIANSPSETRPVFNSIVRSAVELFNVQRAVLMLVAGDQIQLGARAGKYPIGADAHSQVYPIPLNRESPVGQAILDCKTIQISDTESYGVPVVLRDRARVLKFRSNTFVPLVRNGVAIGAIAVPCAEPGLLTDGQVALLNTFADQAVIAIENVRLFNETREALERQTATAEILKVIASSPSDVQPVFDAIAIAAMRLLGGHSSAVTRVVDGMVHLSAHTATSREGSEAIKSFYPRALSSMRGLARAVRSGEPAYLSDTESDSEFSEEAKELARSRGYRSLLWVPMLREGVAFGTINVSRREPGPFADNQVELLKTFADQAVIAVENVRLFNETKEALERQTATAEILNVISSSPTDVQPVFEAIVRTGVRLFKDAAVAVVRPDGGQVQLMAIAESDPGRAAKWAERFPFALDREYIQSAAILDCAMVEVADALQEQESFVVGRRNFLLSGYRAMTVAPMVRENVAIGAISVVRLAPGPLSERQKALLRTFADQAVIAIENVRLFNETRALNEERLARLKSFFSPQLAELLAAGKGEELLKTHRREITVQFFDLRGFTAFTGAAEPEEVMELLRDFHGALGKLVMEHEGTIERFAGDSVMVFFNDPLPVERPAERAVQSALALMRAFDPIATRWKKRGYELGLGAGIAQGFATLGAIGFEGRRDYAAIGPVTNLAARLCAEAKGGQVLVDSKTAASLEGVFDFNALGPFQLKGFVQPVPAFALVGQSKA